MRKSTKLLNHHARYRSYSLAGDNTLLGYSPLTMITNSEILDPLSCIYCVEAINCSQTVQPNHLHEEVKKRNRNTIPTCSKCGQLQIYPFGQDKIPAYPIEYDSMPTTPPDAKDYIPSGEEVPHTKRCTKHNQRFQRRIEDLATWQDTNYRA
jgi:hypothetical protein